MTLYKLLWLSDTLDVMMDNYETTVQLAREKPGHSNEWTEDWIIKMKKMATVTCLQPENPNSPTNTKNLPASAMLNLLYLQFKLQQTLKYSRGNLQ